MINKKIHKAKLVSQDHHEVTILIKLSLVNHDKIFKHRQKSLAWQILSKLRIIVVKIVLLMNR